VSQHPINQVRHLGATRYISMASRFEQIDIVPEQIGHALKDKTLHVPPNQRDYSWQEKHVEDLYADFFVTIDRGAQEYFLGSIVVVRGDDGRHLVVDGQQRLATSLILLAAIRDFLQVELNDIEGARRFERRFIFTEEYRSKDDKPHLVLNERDHPYFLPRVLLNPGDKRRKEVLASKPKLESHRRIDRAAKVAAKQVKAIAAGSTRPEAQADSGVDPVFETTS